MSVPSTGMAICRRAGSWDRLGRSQVSQTSSGGHVGVMMDGRRKVLKNPLSATQDNQLQVNLAFAKVEPAVDEGSLSTRFFMPVCTKSGDGRKVELCDAQTTSFGAMRFSHFINS